MPVFLFGLAAEIANDIILFLCYNHAANKGEP